MKASKSFITTCAAAGLVSAIGLAYAQHSDENPGYTDAELNPVQQMVEEAQPAQATDVLPVQSVDAQQPTSSEQQQVPSSSGMTDSQMPQTQQSSTPAPAEQAPAPTPSYDNTATPAPSSDNNTPLTERAPRADRN